MLRRTLCQFFPSQLSFSAVFHSNRNPAFLLSCCKYSVASGPIADLKASAVTVEKTKSPKELTPANQLVFGHTFTGNYFGRENADVVRSYVDDRVDCYQRLVSWAYYPVPKP